jgi:hypothetical protein
MPDKPDRRRLQRLQSKGHVSYRRPAGGDAQPARCLNLSDSGLLFLGPEAAEIGHALEISLWPDNHSARLLNAFVEVVRCTRSGDGYEIAADIKGIKGS